LRQHAHHRAADRAELLEIAKALDTGTPIPPMPALPPRPARPPSLRPSRQDRAFDDEIPF